MTDTISDKLTRLNEVKQQIKQSIINKGVQVADDTPFSGYPAKIGEISGGAPATRLGASLDTWVGDVVDGVLQKSTEPTALNFAGVTEIGSDALTYVFDHRDNIISVDLGSVQSIGSGSLQDAFAWCQNITSINLSSLQSVGSNGMRNAFQICTGITGALDLSSLQTISNGGLQNAFQQCSRVTSVDLSSLQSVDTYGLNSTFRSCTGLTTISFPSLTSVQTNSFSNTFSGCTNLTEIHFRADMQATIEALSGYADKWGATNATIYFDL